MIAKIECICCLQKLTIPVFLLEIVYEKSDFFLFKGIYNHKFV